MDFVIPVDNSEDERKQKNRQILKFFWRTEKSVEYEGVGDTSCSWYTRNSPQSLEKETEGMGNSMKNRDHGIVEIG